MKKIILLLFFFSLPIIGQTIVTTNPQYPTQTDNITITFDVKNATHANKIAGYTGDVYTHTGVTIKIGSGSASRWQKVIGNWGNNSVQPKLTRIGNDLYQLIIYNPRNFYSVTNSVERITELCFVLRSSDGSKQTEDLFVPLFESGISVLINTPTVNTEFGDPMRSPVFIKSGETININATAATVGTTASSMKIFVNGIEKASASTSTVSFQFIANQYNAGRNDVKVTATDITGQKDSSQFVIMRNPTINNAEVPSGIKHGINYNGNSVTVAIFAPNKNFIYLIGDFNDWKVDVNYLMNKYSPKPDSTIWWLTLSNLISNQEYAYQYLIDGNLRIYDPYTDKVLDPSNDSEVIFSGIYPNLKTYPNQKTSGIVSVFQTNQTPFNWKVKNFIRPSKDKLIIYELLIRDFISTHSYKTLADTISYIKKLGVNAIELMPISEFEGNDSWGYNPMTYFSPDKYYGPKDELKKFIDLCHENGIAVILDIVLNHAYNSNSMARMYWENGRPSSSSPWFNVQSNFQNPDAQWGNDFNHESKHTQYFVDRVLEYWLTEYKFDGFRFDFTKGIGNNIKTMSDPWGSNYDPDRIRLLKRMVDKVWAYDPTAIMIFEHLAVNSEDQELAHYKNGILMWGNMNYNYNEATMGWLSGSNFNGISYKSRGWNSPHLIGYMESHDEERLMFKNLTYGNSSGSYNIKNLTTALRRQQLAAVFFLTIPGPKMIWQFGELGYDISINQGGRLSRKPIKWEYYNDNERRKLFNVYAALNQLKTNEPVFSSSNFVLNASGSVKTITISDNTNNVIIIGNFDVVSQTTTLYHPKPYTWHEYFTRDSVYITDSGFQITLQPGEYRLYSTLKFPKTNILTSVKAEEVIPSEFKLYQNYPNPFNPTTTIQFVIPSPSIDGRRNLEDFSSQTPRNDNVWVTLKVYDILGREVTTLVNEFLQPGTYNSQFSIRNSQLPSGVYFYQLKAGNFIQTKKMMVVK